MTNARYFSGFLLVLLGLGSFTAQPLPQDWRTPFERDSTWSAEWKEAYAYLDRLDEVSDRISIRTFGESDGFLPLREVVISSPEVTTPQEARARNKVVLLINNAIHPGESAGVDASLMLAREMALEDRWQEVLEDMVIVMIPYYNLDGGYARRPHTRANQEGPAMQGFRGNGKNLDLNRDFIKCDSRNAQSFTRLFHDWDPDLFIDTHTSNGADYQATITVIPTQPDKLPPSLKAYQQDVLLPALCKGMAEKNWMMTPYVHSDGPPENGILGFLDLPRYSTGYTALFQTLGFMPETHMLKPFSERVSSTLAFLWTVCETAMGQKAQLFEARSQARREVSSASLWPLQWQLDTSQVDSIWFGGYEHGYKPSAVSGLPRLYYDRSLPYDRRIPYYPAYKAVLSAEKPWGWIIPQPWTAILDRLAWNEVLMYRIVGDTLLRTPVWRILSERTSNQPYEGHYVHSDVQVEEVMDTVLVRDGDIWVPADQSGIAYLMATMDPRAPDSWFAWNFLDAILNQKEYFSDYVFEDLADELLRSDPDLRQQFERERQKHPEWETDANAPLEWVYRHSDYYEPTYRRYPIVKITGPTAFQLRPYRGTSPRD
ncbi:MAG: M14 family zinc carboxypeptidase [Saprospiraceae bacterium]